MGIRNFPVISIGESTGDRTQVVGQSSRLIPTTQSGLAPKYCLVTATPGTLAGNIIYTSPTQGADAGDNSNIPIFCDRPSPIIMLCHGHDRIQRSEVGDSTSYIYVIPLEDY